MFIIIIISMQKQKLHFNNIQIFTSYRAVNTLSRLEQDRQRTYKVILRCVRATIVAVEKQLVLHTLSVCL